MQSAVIDGVFILYWPKSVNRDRSFLSLDVDEIDIDQAVQVNVHTEQAPADLWQDRTSSPEPL